MPEFGSEAFKNNPALEATRQEFERQIMELGVFDDTISSDSTEITS